METLEHRVAIRQNYSAGQDEARRLLTLTPETDKPKLEIEAAERLINSDGYEHSYAQGMWHAVGERPLCLIRRVMEEEDMEL